ncbi:MAG: RCC1 domain-containing protein [Kofleriaceae bacterium]
MPGSWRQVSLGDEGTCAIDTDQRLWCWGKNASGELGVGDIAIRRVPVQVGTSTWLHISLGVESACGIQSNGSLWCWGENSSFQLGDGTTTRRLTPVPIAISTEFRAVSINTTHACAITISGQVQCWGLNANGQLGDGTVDERSTPTPIASDIGPATSLAAGSEHTCAATAERLWCWGAADAGQISGVTRPRQVTPVEVGPLVIDALSSSDTTTCFVDRATTLSCMGGNLWGQAGQAPGVVQQVERADMRSDWTSISAADFSACGKAGGQLWCWGTGEYGKIGDGAEVDRQQPVAVSAGGLDNVVMNPFVAAGASAGRIILWGYDYWTDGLALTPRDVAGGTDIAVGTDHVCVLQAGGAIVCRGDNSFAQQGNGTQATSTSTTHPGPWTDVFAGYLGTCATTGSTLSCWGDGILTGTGTMSLRLTPTVVNGMPSSINTIEFGTSFACALAAGELWCWGDNEEGQLGVVGPAMSLVPVRVGTRSDWVDLALGDRHACAIPSDGTLWCWGHQDDGQQGGRSTDSVPMPRQVDTATDWRDVACGFHFTCAIKVDGTRWCFGSNYSGELGNGRSWLEAPVPIR